MGLLQLLVEKDIFVKIKLSFLPVGHTHDDVDQFFSKINAELLRRDIFTVNDLHTAVKQSFNPVPVCIHLEKMGMFVPWLLESMENQIEGTSKPHCFLFKRGPSGRAGHFYRQLMQTSKSTTVDCWFPANNPDGFNIFKEGGVETLDIEKVPCVPLKPLDIPKIQETVDTMQFAMPEADVAWWTKTLEIMQEQDEGACEECSSCRQAQSECISSKNDSASVRKTKSAVSRQQTKTLRSHILEVQHELYEDWLPPKRVAVARASIAEGLFVLCFLCFTNSSLRNTK
jgi:hypothetical protein